MPNALAPFRGELYTLIKATLPEVIGPIATVPQVQRINWVNQVKTGGIVPPWIAVHIPALVPDDEFSSISTVAWSVSPTIYYIGSVSDGHGSVGDYLESRMALLETALSFWPSYTVSAIPIVDVSEDNPVNASLLMNDMPFLSASLAFSAIIGYLERHL